MYLNYYDDTKRYIDANRALDIGQKQMIFAENAMRVFPRLSAYDLL